MPDQLIKTLVDNNDFTTVATSDEARDSDRFTIAELGIESKILMECAGGQVAKSVMDMVKRLKNPTVLVFVGPGNNGADAIVASRHLLAANITGRIFFLAEEEKWSPDLSYQVRILRNALAKLPCNSWQLSPFSPAISLTDSSHIIIDGIFGAGLSRAPQGLPQQAIIWINRLRAHKPDTTRIISIDIPSGQSLNAKRCDLDSVCADVTVTFQHLKRAHISEPTKRYCGTTVVENIGLFNRYELTTFYRRQRRTLRSLFRPIPDNCHKGHFGHVLVFEGNSRYLGASRLAARAALRVGAGLVTIATDQSILPTSFDLAEFMRVNRNDIDDQFMKKIDVVIVGPGLSTDAYWQTAALNFLTKFKNQIAAMVIDADALRILPHLGEVAHPIIATPHPKEAADHLGINVTDVENDRFSCITQLAQKSAERKQNIIWVLKGATTLVRALSGEIFAFRGDVPALSAGGSGDVLSGAIAGLIKQTDNPLAQALLGVSIHIEGAARLSRHLYKGSLASELADTFPVFTKSRPRT